VTEHKPRPALRDTREDDNVLLDADEDRWEWRRKIRSDPRKHRIYRIVVGVVGTFLILLAGATGWLPGPGGIPLALLGLAVLASEFEWAQRLLHWVHEQLHRGRVWMQQQPRWVSWSSGVLTVAFICFAVWMTLLIFGYPSWTPDVVGSYLDLVPGVGPGG
jgi:uncharacterized protein (TIGR02611 family)